MSAPLAVTAGEPGGVGPELVVRLAQMPDLPPWVAVGDPDLFARAARRMDLPLRILQPQQAPATPGALCVEPRTLGAPETPGRADPTHANYVVGCLDAAIEGALAERFAGVVTGPLQKASVIEGGFPEFTGHTEYLAQRCGVEHVVMLLVAGDLRVALATTHLPLRAVPDAITEPLLEATLEVLIRGLRDRFGCGTPRVLVAGLNPHAGEGGHLGVEDDQVIAPVCERWRANGVDVSGPLPADTVFTPRWLAQGDAVLAMYHDQGLPTLKYAGFGEAVNVTLGLPIVRTSVDHGTALDIAGRGAADCGSLLAALRLADRMSGGGMR